MSLSRCNYKINSLGGRCQELKGHDGGVHEVEAEIVRRVAEHLDQRRSDPDFAKRLAERMEQDRTILDRLKDTPTPGRRERMEKRVLYSLLRRALGNLPHGLYIGANRYDTDDKAVLHLWTAEGQSYDVTWAKEADE